MSYTVQQLAKLAGVSARTLRFYDQVGLLSPSLRGKNRYRHYGESELIRLQQILFFRELDFPLEEIKRLLTHPQFARRESLLYQKGLLQLKQKRLGKIIRTIETTLKTMSTPQPADDRDLYGALSSEEIETYKQEAQERWGNTDAYRISQERVKKMSREEIKEMQAAGDALMQQLVARMLAGNAPADPEVQQLISQHHAGIERFYPCSTTMYRGLADMYLADQRFTDYYRKYHQDLPAFLVKGMHVFCEMREKK